MSSDLESKKAPRKRSAANDELISTIQALTARIEQLEQKISDSAAAAHVEDPMAGFADDLAFALQNPEPDEPDTDDDLEGEQFDFERDPEDDLLEQQLASEIPVKYPELIEEINRFNEEQEAEEVEPVTRDIEDELVEQLIEPHEAVPGIDLSSFDAMLDSASTGEVHDMMESWVSEAIQAQEPAAPVTPEAEEAVSAAPAQPTRQPKEKKIEISSDGGGDIDADEIAAMFAQAEAKFPTAPEFEEVDASSMSADDIAALFAEATVQEEEPRTMMSDDEIAALIAESNQDDSNTMASEDDIAALFAQAEALESATAAPSTKDLNASDIAALLTSPTDDEDLSTDVVATSAKGSATKASATDLVKELTDTELPDTEDLLDQVEHPAQEEAAALPFAFDASLASVVPMELAVAALALPISRSPGKLVCMVAEPFDHDALGNLSKAVGLLIETKPSSIDQVVHGLKLFYEEGQSKRSFSEACRSALSKPDPVLQIIQLIRKAVA